MTDKHADLFAALSAPFPPEEIDWKPQFVKGNRALAIAYIDARTVMDRLDSALGLGNWQTTYRELPDGIVCRLRVRIGGEWVEHEDVGSFSEQPDGGDRLKAAFSDALKRVAVHLGVGRYLYELPKQWCDYDPVKKCFAQTPQLPEKFLPARQAAAGTPDPAEQFAVQIREAPTLDALRTTFEAACAARSRLAEAELATLIRLKDERKAALSAPAGAPPAGKPAPETTRPADPLDRDDLIARLADTAKALNQKPEQLIARHAKAIGLDDRRPWPAADKFTTPQLEHLVGLAEQEANLKAGAAR